jgi:putative sigma-54 modulation protein
LQLYLTGKHFKVVPRLRAHIEEHLEKLSRYDSHIISAHVVLTIEKYMNVAEVTLKASHFQFYGEGSSDDNMFSAVDLAINRVESQLKKHREKFKSLKKQNSRLTSVRVRRSSGGRSPEVVSSEVSSPKPLSTEEASLQLQVSDKEFLVFRNSITNKINVMYRRPDGHHGLVEPEA